LLVTVVSALYMLDVDFLPLSVEYQELLSASGRIPCCFF